jgi:electron transfer flavoprotein beta subunit
MAAKKKPVDKVAAGAASIDPAKAGVAGSGSKVLDATVAPPRAKGTIVTDEGSGGVELADFLASKKFI